jgi:hypothetical protein
MLSWAMKIRDLTFPETLGLGHKKLAKETCFTPSSKNFNILLHCLESLLCNQN